MATITILVIWRRRMGPFRLTPILARTYSVNPSSTRQLLFWPGIKVRDPFLHPRQRMRMLALGQRGGRPPCATQGFLELQIIGSLEDLKCKFHQRCLWSSS